MYDNFLIRAGLHPTSIDMQGSYYPLSVRGAARGQYREFVGALTVIPQVQSIDWSSVLNRTDICQQCVKLFTKRQKQNRNTIIIFN